MSNNEKLDKLIQMVYDLGKQVEVIQNLLGVKRNAADDEEICDEEAISATQQLREVNILGENESTEKITQDKETEKIEKESCTKQKSQVTSSSQTFTTPNFDTRVTNAYPTYITPKSDLLSQESRHSGKGATEVLMRDVGEKSEFQPLMKTKKRSVQQDNQYIEAGLELLKLRKRNNPDLFLNKTALVVGVKFLEEIDELYDEFLDDKEGFQFESVFGKYNIEKNISLLYSAIEIEEKYWLGIVVNLEKRSITAFNSAAVKYTDASVGAYVNAYAMVLPFMIRNIFKDVNVDTSKFDINVVSEDYPQVLKIEDSGVYALKLIECHAMRIVDFTKLSEEKIAFIREKLAVDIFSELQ
ncbi:hypothetical protein Bca101_083036 [Brassica carinata]